MSDLKASPIIGNDFKDKSVLIVDASHWQDDLDPTKLVEGGVVSIILKFGSGGNQTDPKVRKLVPLVKSSGASLGSYFWTDGTHNGVQQAEDFMRLIDELKPDYLANDNEQDWSDWDKWTLYKQGKIPWSQVPKLSQKQILRVNEDFTNRIVTLAPELPKLHYAGKERTALMLPILPLIEEAYDPWWPQYPLGRARIVVSSWKKLENYYPWGYWGKPRGVLPQMKKKPVLWQWTGDRYILPGCSTQLDINFWDGNLAGFLSWIKRESLPIPEPLPFDKATLKDGYGGLNIREVNEDPDSRSLRVIQPREIVYLEPGVTKWRKLYGENGYVNSGFLKIL